MTTSKKPAAKKVGSGAARRQDLPPDAGMSLPGLQPQTTSPMPLPPSTVKTPTTSRPVPKPGFKKKVGVGAALPMNPPLMLPMSPPGSPASPPYGQAPAMPPPTSMPPELTLPPPLPKKRAPAKKKAKKKSSARKNKKGVTAATKQPKKAQPTQPKTAFSKKEPH